MLLLLCFPTFPFIQGYQQWDSNKAKHLRNVRRRSCKAEQKSLGTLELTPVLQERGWEGFPWKFHLWDDAEDGIRAPQSPPKFQFFPPTLPTVLVPSGSSTLLGMTRGVQTQIVPSKPILRAFPRDQARLSLRKGRNSTNSCSPLPAQGSEARLGVPCPHGRGRAVPSSHGSAFQGAPGSCHPPSQPAAPASCHCRYQKISTHPQVDSTGPSR